MGWEEAGLAGEVSQVLEAAAGLRGHLEDLEWRSSGGRRPGGRRLGGGRGVGDYFEDELADNEEEDPL